MGKSIACVSWARQETASNGLSDTAGSEEVCSVSTGQFSGVFNRKEGSVNQRQVSVRSAMGMPLVASSAGLMLPGQWGHWWTVVVSRISETRLAMKICCRLCEFRIHWTTVVLSDQKKVCDIGKVDSLLTKLAIRVPSTAAWSSSFVIVCCLRGATRAFPKTNALSNVSLLGKS